MPRWRLWARNDDGSAALEFITAGVILLVPLAYLVITLGAVQESLLGVEAAARHTARVIGQADDVDSAATNSDAVLTSVMDEYGMDAESVDVSMSCAPAGAACPSAGATVIVTVRTRVSLPFVPPIFGLDRAASIPLEAVAAQKVSRLWGTG
ncbi:TadE family protein [Microbacterium sp.]|uniref:TadE family protein n=1 Tax=Microbacterium sp. TaxID=51671 RepID=UPI00273614D0|nr:TadE family protein [Microbacterium sp.]MDP3949036.1 TadE family protein [Microbacterium sp.]